MHGDQQVDVPERLGGGRHGLDLDRLSRFGRDLVHAGATTPQPRAEPGTVGTGDDIERHQAGPRQAGRHRLQREHRLGLDEQQVAARGEQVLETIGEPRVTVVRIGRRIEQQMGIEANHGERESGARAARDGQVRRGTRRESISLTRRAPRSRRGAQPVASMRSWGVRCRRRTRKLAASSTPQAPASIHGGLLSPGQRRVGNRGATGVRAR